MPEKRSRREFLKAVAIGTAGVTAASLAPQVLAQQRDLSGEAAGEIGIRGVRLRRITLNINGRDTTLEVEPRETLVNVLRNRLALTGTKRPCNRAECSGCTVVIDGRAVLSCTTLAIDVEKTKILTVEGLAQGDKLHPVQQGFADEYGYQCGYCTPGQIMSAYALLERNRNPSIAEIKLAMSGNLCKCGAYPNILRSALRAVELIRGRA